MHQIGKLLVIIGFLTIVIGAVFMLAGRVPWLGRLPGDILIKRDNFVFYFPIVTSIIVSIVLSVLLTLLFLIFSRGR